MILPQTRTASRQNAHRYGRCASGRAYLGTPRLITDQQQNTVWRWDNQEPFGNTPPNEDPNGTGTRFVFNHRYPGQYFDQETNLFYNLNRYYDSVTGKYTTFDPIGLRGGINGYVYVGSNPLSRKDPKGLECPPGDVTCKIANRNAGLPPDPPPASRAKKTCEYVCDAAISLPCKSAALACSTVGAGVAVYGACNAGAAVYCHYACDDADNPPADQPFMVSP